MATLAATLPYARPVARPLAVSNWLIGVAGLVFLMIVVGGITRLTESGLSITRWEPFTGAIPPLSAADWDRQFALYRESSQYQLATRGMSLAQFKFIFFWEYIHRLLGRLIGLAFALPLAFFALKRWIPSGYGPRLAALLALGGLQGAIGWWMVQSGLVNRVDVAHERLAVHLLTALTILALLLWTALDLRALPSPGLASGSATLSRWREREGPTPQVWDGEGGAHAAGVGGRGKSRWPLPFFALLFTQFLFGALTAGLKAGHLYNSWPLIAGGLAPPELGHLTPLWNDLVNNPVTVQYVHRTLALSVAAAALWIAARTARAGAGWRAGALAAAVILQFGLGVLTLIHNVPVPLGVAHQAGAAILLAASVTLAHWARRRAA